MKEKNTFTGIPSNHGKSTWPSCGEKELNEGKKL